MLNGSLVPPAFRAYQLLEIFFIVNNFRIGQYLRNFAVIYIVKVDFIPKVVYFSIWANVICTTKPIIVF